MAGSSSTTRRRAPVGSPCGPLTDIAADRKSEHHSRPLTHLAVDPDRAVVGFDEPFRDREAKADSAGRLAWTRQTYEGHEDPIGVRRWNARAAVRDFETHVAVVAAYADSDLAAGRRELRGVLDEIREHMLDLDVVELDRGKVLLHIQPHRVFGRDRPETTRDVLDERTNVVPGLVRNKAPVLDAREVEEIADDAVEAERLFLDRHRELVAVPIGPNDVTLPQAPGGRPRRCGSSTRSSLLAPRSARRAASSRAAIAGRGRISASVSIASPSRSRAPRRCSATAASARSRSGSAMRNAASYRRVASRSRCFASWARARSRAASVPVTIAVSRKSARENSSSGFATTS